MIVTCPNCSTKFNLPETQAAPGAKLRCSVCKHVFQLSDGVKPAEIRMEPDLSLSSPSLSMPPKKKGGIWGWVLTLLLLCAVAGGTWWAWTYTPLFDTVKEMIAPPKKQDPVELVKNIALRGVRQYNISNEKLGNISVVEGKVVNGFNQPRELIRIEASLYDSAGNALVSKQQVQEEETQELIDKVFDGSADKLFAALVGGKRVSAEQLQKLRTLIDDMDD